MDGTQFNYYFHYCYCCDVFPGFYLIKFVLFCIYLTTELDGPDFNVQIL